MINRGGKLSGGLQLPDGSSVHHSASISILYRISLPGTSGIGSSGGFGCLRGRPRPLFTITEVVLSARQPRCAIDGVVENLIKTDEIQMFEIVDKKFT